MGSEYQENTKDTIFLLYLGAITSATGIPMGQRRRNDLISPFGGGDLRSSFAGSRGRTHLGQPQNFYLTIKQYTC